MPPLPLLLQLACLALPFAQARGSYPTDSGLAAPVLVPLSGASGGAWRLRSSANASLRLAAAVPGDLISDLQLGGVIGDPLYEQNFKDPVWDSGNYTYSLTFGAPAALRASASAWLVFEGVKMVADVTLNGQWLGYFNDQFLRYSFPVSPSALLAQGNVLEVTFPPFSDPRSLTQRLMGCSGGWDWAPFSGTFINKSVGTFSKGIWRPVYLAGAGAGGALLAHVAPRVHYKGPYPSAPLTDGSHGDFEVRVAVHFEAGAGGGAGTLAVVGGWAGGAAAPQRVALPAGNSSVTVVLSAAASAVRLWWPAHTPGNQTRYPVTATFTPDGGGASVQDARKIGFRVFTLVTGNDTDPATLAGRDGQDHYTMRFKVNGADIWSRGSNMIPMEELEGRTTAEGLRRLVQSGVEGGFNTFRLWGGGIFQYDAFYDACDEMGVLIYHDMMYTQGHKPTASAMQADEIAHQVRRLAHHPSIAVWDACNECGGGGIYADFVMTTVVSEDTSRPPWPSCPANGWTSGVDALWGLPNGSPLGLQPRLAAASGGEEWQQQVLRGGCSAQAGAVAQAMGCAEGDGCTYVPNQDYAGGAGGPHAPADSVAECCALCAANADCEAGVFQSYGCFFKTKADAVSPMYKEGVIAAWPAGRTPPAPGPPSLGCSKQYSYETHGFYLHGDGYKTVNSKDGKLGSYDVNMPPAMMQEAALTGPACPGTYSSEFGAVAISSWESLSPTLAPADWGLHNAAMAQRNYAVDNIVVATANTPWPSGFDNVTGELPLKKNLYFAMLGQALFVKSAIEGRKSGNSFGSIIWQFNEVWPTGGWGSIEYGTVGFTPGQVEGGRWKPLQYFLRRFLYRDHHIAASVDARVHVRSDDAFASTNATATLTYLHLATGANSPGASFPVALPPGASASVWGCADGVSGTWQCDRWAQLLPRVGCASDGSDCVLLLRVTDNASGQLLAENFELLAPVWRLALPAANVTAAVGAPQADGSVPITLTASATALFVHLTTLAQGRFSDNSLLLPPGDTVVSFLPWGPLDAELLRSSLRVEHVQLYGVNSTAE